MASCIQDGCNTKIMKAHASFNPPVLVEMSSLIGLGDIGKDVSECFVENAVKGRPGIDEANPDGGVVPAAPVVDSKHAKEYHPALDESPYTEIHDVAENPPTFDSPLLRGDHLSYTTSRSAESIVCEPEHKFVTIEANTCSTYREAA